MFAASCARFWFRVFGVLVVSWYSSRVTGIQSWLVWGSAMVVDMFSPTPWWFFIELFDHCQWSCFLRMLMYAKFCTHCFFDYYRSLSLMMQTLNSSSERIDCWLFWSMYLNPHLCVLYPPPSLLVDVVQQPCLSSLSFICPWCPSLLFLLSSI